MLIVSAGTTVPYGSAIMTGTPSGVGWFHKPQVCLKDGDVVEVEIQPIGVLKNKIVFEK
jgi:2-keto-4-pentenoate hydratase/2-oxohepta-3-ene-1,7-dioic acid hydratase in catechol pathway